MTTGPLSLTIRRQGEMLTMDLAEVDPLVPRGEVRITEGLLAEISEQLARIVAIANARAALRMTNPTVSDTPLESAQAALQSLGTLLFSHLFPAETRQRLSAAPTTDLFLRLDDQLVHVPWELAFDGQEFLLTKFRIGRQVITNQPPVDYHGRRRHDPEQLRMLIVVDPTESLPAAVEEAECIDNLLAETCSNLEVHVKSGTRLRKLDLLQDLNTYDLVHYAGHAVFDPKAPEQSGWVLPDDVLTASELSRLAHPPLLVFANACQAGATTRWEYEPLYEGQAFGIGSAFLLAGSQYYIGTFCVIHDAHSAAFAVDFYRHLLQGERLGVALAAARHQARQTSDSSGLLWASYMHYGNPTFRLPLITAPAPEVSDLRPSTAGRVFEEAMRPHTAQRIAGVSGTAPTPEPPAAPESAVTAQIAMPSETRRVSDWQRRWLLMLGIGLGLAGLLAAFWLYQPEDTWTSRPLTFAVLPLERTGSPTAGAGDEEIVQTRLTQALQAGGRLKVVERALLDKVLAELKLGTSDLVDPQAALRVGRILAARLIAIGHVQYIGERTQLSLRLIDTETTLTPAMEVDMVETPDALASVLPHLTHTLLQQLRHAYPLQGRITHLTPQGVLLNIGTQHGVTPGLTLEVFQSATPLDIETPLGQVVVTHVDARRSQARVVTASLTVQPGWRVKEGQ